jgi:hypothetical protein
VSSPIDLAGALVLENGSRLGDCWSPDQWEDARAVLDPESATPYHFLTRARGYEKTQDCGAIAVAAMLAQLPAGSRLYGLASDLDQGRLLVDSVAGFATRTPELGGSLTVDQYKVTSASGSVLQILAADAGGAYGLRPALLVCDEIAQWASTAAPRRLWEATTSAMTKIPGSRLVALTSAGDPSHWSHRVLEHAYADPLWRVHELAGPPPWADPARLAEQRRRLPESVYLRLFENQWQSAEDRLTSLEDLRACVRLAGPLDPVPNVQYVVGCDLGLKRDRSVVAVCHAERQDTGVRMVLDHMRTWEGKRLSPVRLGDVEEHLVDVSRRYNGARVVIDPWQSAGLSQRLRSGGVKVDEFVFSQTSVGRLAAALHTTIRDHRLVLPDDEELIEELSNVRLRETAPGVLRMDHDPDKHDDRAIALALAIHGFVESGLGVGAAWLEVWEKELADNAADLAAKALAEHPEIRALPRFVEYERTIAGPTCPTPTGPRHRFERKPEGEVCMACGGWRTPEEAA